MKKIALSNDLSAYCFDDLKDFETYVYVIRRNNTFIFIDTFCGPDYMKDIIKDLNITNKRQRYLIINTHYHWDHIWGNCAFPNSPIYSHWLCRQLIENTWDIQKKENLSFFGTNTTKMLPNYTFCNNHILSACGLTLLHTPGHTADCISVKDTRNKILFVGDNLEHPLPYIEQPNLSLYLETLKKYRSYYDFPFLGGHSLKLTPGDNENSIHYLDSLISKKELHFHNPKEQSVHRTNLSFLLSIK